MNKLIVKAALGASACWLTAIPAFAQELEEVTVTATRRNESAQTVPISITAISAENLQAARVEGVRDLAFTTPGLQIANRSAAFVPYIRGIGSLDVSGGQETAVAVYVDGVYIPSVWGAHLSFNSIDRIEVLKGPQGTLFGRNATGGLIHIITKDPTHETQVNGSVSVGNYQSAGAKFYAGTGLTDSLAADLAVYYENQDDAFGKNAFTAGPKLEGQKDYGARTKWLYDISDATKLTVTADYSKRRSGLGDNRSILPGSVSNFGPGAVFTAPANAEDAQLNFAVYHDVKNWGGMVKLQHSFGNFDFNSITAYRGVDGLGSFDNDGTPAPIVNVTNRFESRTFTQEIQFLSQKGDRFKWIAGAFYLDDSNGYIRPGGLLLSGGAFFGAVAPGQPGAFGFAHQVKTKSYAGFAEGTYSFSDTTRATVGVRWTHDQKDIVGGTEVYSGAGALTGINPTLVVFAPFAGATATFSKPTWRLVLQHDLNDRSMVYGSYNRGFRSGSYNTVGVDGLPVNPEIVDAFELGWKNQLLDNRLRLNLAAFHTKYKDLQIAASDRNTQRLLNIANAKIQGFEIEGEGLVSENLSLTFGVEYLDTKFTDFDKNVVPPCTARNGAGATVADPTCVIVGNQLMRAPKMQLNAGARVQHAVGTGRIGADLNLYYSDKFPWEIDNRLWEKAYSVVNASVYWSGKDDHYTITAFAKNLLDETYDAFVVGQAGLNDQHSVAPPRTYGLEFGFKF